MAAHDDTSTRSWEAAADDWVAHADASDYQNLFLRPRMLALAGNVAGRRVLDLGCGEGSYSRALTGRGARVIGVDGSARLIEVARQRAAAARLDIDLRCLNANALEGIAAGTIDLIVASMILMNVEDYPGAVREAHRVLVPGGELCASITHPCFSAPVSDWVNGKGRTSQHFAVDRYFERIAWPDRIAPTFRTPTLRRHRPLEDYIGGALRAGLVLRELQEPMATEQELKASARFEPMTRVPYFLFMRWQKPPSTQPGTSPPSSAG
jgi:2-polyprenyl-3-methyl-5-hydroxy-6-metoxy-1,4-benzoquinol methylase